MLGYLYELYYEANLKVGAGLVACDGRTPRSARPARRRPGAALRGEVRRVRHVQLCHHKETIALLYTRAATVVATSGTRISRHVNTTSLQMRWCQRGVWCLCFRLAPPSKKSY